LILCTKPNTTIVTTKPITYSLTVKDLKGLALSVSGSIRVPTLTTTALSIKISGSGTITANGTANDQDLEISGSGRLASRWTDEQGREGAHLWDRYGERCRYGCA
jgi:hypothetical protein